MTTPTPDEKGYYRIDQEPITPVIELLRTLETIPKLSITGIQTVGIDHAREMRRLKAVDQVWLWCNTTRDALSELVMLPGLRVLDVLSLEGSARLSGFSHATALEEVRINHYLKAEDVLDVAGCSTIKELGIQSATLTPAVVDALIALPNLASLDVEGTNLDDPMLECLCSKRSLTQLDIGATAITRRGLTAVCASMPQLHSLDLWSTKLTLDDLQLLTKLPKLEYLSVGDLEGLCDWDQVLLTRLLLDLPALKRVWIDGVEIDNAHREMLSTKLERVMVT
ncbi:leucine-rich repeat domain-containing protein [Piscinibacterium candidicorallinum]|uniref:Internalin-A n=2 Tax=Piscinibacterium candidicorallinum TaxID=1793872 RepID=A0ABV7H4M2_9BURK